MAALFSYILKVSVCYAVIYLFYFLLLRQLTYYKINRFFLLIASLIVFAIPLIDVYSFLSSETIRSSVVLSNVPVISASANEIFIPGTQQPGFAEGIAVALLFTGMAACLTYFVIQLFSFRKLTGKASLAGVTNGIKLYNLEMDIMPFSFGNNIYINKEKHTANELNEILQHEAVHVRQKHTIDILLAELVCILNWYNPFVWLIRNSIKQNLEFLADEAVVNTGTEKKSYQYLLLKVAGYSLPIVSSFNFTSLKSRIYMMNKERTSKKHLLKLFMLLPLMALLMVAFRDDTRVTKQSSANEESYTLGSLNYSIADPRVAALVKQQENKSYLQVGKTFSIALIKNERDRLRSLLQSKGYNNIDNHAITFLIDSTASNTNFSVEVNIDLNRKKEEINTNNKNQSISYLPFDTGKNTGEAITENNRKAAQRT